MEPSSGHANPVRFTKLRLEMRQFQRLFTAAGAALLALNTVPFGFQAASAAPTDVSGVVFEDWNQNGIRDAVEPGIGGVSVTATSALGAVITTSSASDGTYVLAGVTGNQRVEFTGQPAWMYPAPHGTGIGVVNNTTVQFVSPGDTANTAFADPADYAQANPNFVLPRQLDGDRSASTAIALHQYPWNVSGNSNITPSTDLGKMNEVGTTYGVGWNRVGKQLFLGAFIKRHAGLQSDGSGNAMPGAIYMVDYTNSASPARPVLWTTVSGVGSVPSDSGRGLPVTPGTPSRDPNLMSLVGKAGLGDLEVSPDGKTLYVVNLATQQLVAIDTATKAQTTSSLPAYTCISGVNRPFALSWHHGKLLVGATCTAELGGTAANLSANVWEFTEGTGFGPTPLLGAAGIALNYPRSDSAGNGGPRNNGPFNPWTDDFSVISATSLNRTTYRQIGYPMPLLSDIEFTDAGAMILGFRDRTGDLTGVNNYAPTGTDTTLYDGVTGGETLQVNNIGGTWTLESPLNATSEIFKDNFGGGEHFETTQGALATVRGTGTIVSTLMDPAQFGTGGAKFFDATGAGTRILTNFGWYGSTPGYFGKANGLGDLEALVDEAPIEIGNRVWIDSNANGIQDPSDIGIGSVSVELWKGDVLVGTTVTAADGTYYFNTSNVNLNGATRILPGSSDYEIRIPNSTGASQQGPLAQLILTTTNAVSDTLDTIDSDASIAAAATTAIIPLAASQIAGPGQNNHTFDAGFTRTYSLGNRVWFDTNNNGTTDTTELPVSGVKVTLLDSSGNPVPGQTATTDGNGHYRFDKLVAGDYTVRIESTNFVAGGPLAGYSSSTPTSTNPNDDVDRDDNGLQPMIPDAVLNQGIVSGVVTLGPETSEPSTETDVATTPGEAPNTQSNLTIDFGFFKTTVGNTLWYDANNDGKIDPTETRINGVVVNLVNATTGAVIGTATTDANGQYQISTTTNGGPLPVGVAVKIVIPTGQTSLTGYKPSTPTSLADNNNHGTLQTDGATASQPFTLIPGATTGGQTVDNGTGTTANPTLDFGFNAPIGTTAPTPTTTPSPTTTLSPTAAPTTPVVTTPVVTTPVVTTPVVTTPPSTPTTGPSPTESTTPPKTGTGALEVKIFVDNNQNGKQDGNDISLPNVTVEVRNSAGVVVITSTTDSTGIVVVNNLPVDDYTVIIVSGVPAEYSYLTNPSITVKVLADETSRSKAEFRLTTSSAELAFTGSNTAPLRAIGIVTTMLGLLILAATRRPSLNSRKGRD
jgi:SdrD B-like domain